MHTTRAVFVRPLAAGAGAIALLAAGACGPIVFQGKSAIAVAGDLPPPPPAPPPAPPPKPKRVEIRETKIEINEKVQFELAKDAIKPESHGLLDEIAQVLADNPQIEQVQIEGHASAEGRADKNRKLSQKRAEAIHKYLAGKGIAPGRLAAKGFGSDKPIADNASEEGREKNRRVEFNILKQRPKKLKVPAEGAADDAAGAAEGGM